MKEIKSVLDVLNAYGDPEFQYLDKCTSKFAMRNDGTTDAVIVTEVGFTARGFDKVGVIAWMDRARLAKLLKTGKE